jgi:uncharacterized membrane protein
MHGFLLFAHLVGVVVWIGGMFFAAVCLHPSLAALAGKDRVDLMSGTLRRFFNWVALSIALIWASGLGMIAAAGIDGMPIGWHLMIGLGAVMTLVFAYVVVALFRPAQRALAQGDMAAVAGLLGRIRRLVLLNLVLGAAAIAAVTMVY